MGHRLMANESNHLAATPYQCWSCKGEVAPTDKFCRHCGMRLTQEGSGATVQPQQQPMVAGVNIHERLVSIEKLLLKTVIGVGALLILVAWIALQLHHFGRE